MKHSTIYIIGLVLLCLTACQHDTPENVGNFIDYSLKSNHGKAFVVTDEQDRVIESDPKPRQASSLSTSSIARGILSSIAGQTVHQVNGTYQTINEHGESVMASGAIFYPTNKRAKNIVLVSHYTVAANYEAPTQTFPLEAYLATKGYVVLMPDYLGYGATVERIHPYLQNYLTSINVIDMLYSSYPFLAAREIQVAADSIILAGYSQGGVTSAFVQQVIETDDDYSDILLLSNYCGGGPYYPYVTYWVYRNKDVSDIPYAMPMTIAGMAIGRDSVLSLDFFFQDYLLEHFDEWFVSKKYNGQEINALMGTNKLSEMLKPQAFVDSLETMQEFFAELHENGMAPGYVPRAPMYVFHSTRDNVVPFENADTLRARFNYWPTIMDDPTPANVTYDFADYGNHMNGFLNFFFGAIWSRL